MERASDMRGSVERKTRNEKRKTAETGQTTTADTSVSTVFIFRCSFFVRYAAWRLRRTGFWTRPLRIALALTLMRTTRPFTTARTFWMFALNLRAVIPVVLVPTPPRYLALPRWVFWLPKVVFLPVK